MSAPAKLRAAQQWFLAVVTHPGGVAAGCAGRDPIDAVITPSRRVSAPDRLSVYARAYYARLIECLGESFPAFKRALGETLFDGFAFGYLQRHPPCSYTLAALGSRFVRYLEETRPTGEDWPDLLIELATLESSVDEVFDGPGIEGRATLRPEDVLGVPRERWLEIRFRTVPCLRLLRFRYPINDYYTALRRGDAPESLPRPAERESFLALTRRDFIVRRHDLERQEYEALTALAQGEPIRAAIARAAETSDLDDDALAANVQDWFRRWSSRQFLARIIHEGEPEEGRRGQ